MAQDRLITEAVLEARIAPSIDRALRAIEDLQNSVRGLGDSFRPVDSDANRTEREIQDIGRTGQRAGRQAAQGIRRLRDSLRDATQSASGLRAALTAVATAGIFTQQQRQFEQFQQFRIEAPQLDADQAQRAFRTAQVLGFNESFLATFFKDLEERIGEGNEDVRNALAELGTSAGQVLALDEFERLTFLAERLAQADADRRIYLADVLAAGQGGELLSRAAFDPQFRERLTAELERESTLTEEQLANWERSQRSVGRITTALGEAAQIILGSWAPGLEFAADALEAGVRFLGRMREIFGPIFSIVTAIGAVVTTIATSLGLWTLTLGKLVGGGGLLAGVGAALAPILAVVAAIAGTLATIINTINRVKELRENLQENPERRGQAITEFLVNTSTPGLVTSLARDVGLTDFNLGERAANLLPEPSQTSPTQTNNIEVNVNVDRVENLDRDIDEINRMLQRLGGF